MKYINQTFNFLDKSLSLTFKALDKVLSSLITGISLVFKALKRLYERYGIVLRIMSIPWNYVIIFLYKKLIVNKTDRIPLLQPGVHMIRASVGGGKSLTSFVLAEYCLEHFGEVSYFTSPVEKPQLSEDGKYYYVMHRVINMNDYYQDGKKVMNHNFQKYPYMHKDERHLTYNPRLNKTKEYNDRFIPEHEDQLLMRHQGAKALYMYSQHVRLDTQEMETITLMHEVSTKKDIVYKKWLQNDVFVYIPTKLKFKTYKIDFEFDGSYSRTLVKKWKLDVPLEVLERYDTHAEANKYSHLKIDYK